MALHRFLVLALLVPLCAAGVFRMPLRRRESLHDRLVREGKWEEYAKQREALRRSGQIPSRVRDYADNVYDTDIYLGTPPQRFTVIFDTGSGDLWVTDASCQSPRCAEKARYDNSTSSSYEYDGTKWFIGYKDGTHIDGHWAKESLTLGDLNASSLAVKSAFFAQAVTETTPNPANLDDFDGILGLSRGSQFGKTSLATAIQQGLLTEPVFTIWLEHVYAESNVTGGQVLFGGIDTEHCGEVIDYVPIANPNDQSWNFAVTGFQFNDVTAAGYFVGITDTGTSDMYVPLSIFDAVVSAANATPSDSRPRVACDAKFSPIVLTINGKQYPVSAEALINRDSEGCYLSLGASDLLILGDPFIRQYCQIHDLGQDRLGFAKALSK